MVMIWKKINANNSFPERKSNNNLEIPAEF
jgi:hypothetical protein